MSILCIIRPLEFVGILEDTGLDIIWLSQQESLRIYFLAIFVFHRGLLAGSLLLQGRESSRQILKRPGNDNVQNMEGFWGYYYLAW